MSASESARDAEIEALLCGPAYSDDRSSYASHGVDNTAAILDTLYDCMYIVFVWRGKKDNNIDNLIDKGRVAHCELVFKIKCTGYDGTRECWCKRHPGFASSTIDEVTGECTNTAYPDAQYDMHTIAFTVYRNRVSDMLKTITGGCVAPPTAVSGVVMRLDAYLDARASDTERYEYFEIYPQRKNMTSLQIVRDTFRWCLSQCVDQTDRSLLRARGYAHTRAVLGAVAAQFATPTGTLGRCLSRARRRSKGRARWYCSEFATHALLDTGLFDLIETGVLHTSLMTPSNLYTTIKLCNQNGAVRVMVALPISREFELKNSRRPP
jgi:hypothetical protein